MNSDLETLSQAIPLIDHCASNGNITMHVLRDNERSLCGIRFNDSQRPAGNMPCKRCARLLKRKDASLGERFAAL